MAFLEHLRLSLLKILAHRELELLRMWHPWSRDFRGQFQRL
jgi:hypothetical protein